MQGEDLSWGGGVPLVGNWSEMLPTDWNRDILPVWVLTGSSVFLVLNHGLDIINLGLHIVDGVRLPCVEGDLFAVKGGPNPGPRHVDNVSISERYCMLTLP
jgi:hypothetical protein